jgi:alpha-L-arabinofuranosidase
MINDAIKARYPDIIVIGTTGPFTDGRDYDEGWKFAKEQKLPMVDEHGYKSPAWFWQNLERFDAYDRAAAKVYLGEYAAHDSDRANTLRSALAETAYLTTLERNGDLVILSSYAPLLSKQRRTQWRPDLIYFDNVSVTPSINYYVQQLFSVNNGDVYLPTTVTIQTPGDTQSAAVPGGILLGTWDSQAKFDDVKVVNGTKVVMDESFAGADSRWNTLSGRWQIADGAYAQSSSDTPALSRAAFDDNKSGCTVTLRAMKTGGAEGFLVGFGAIDTQNYYWLNLGGWNNTRHQIEKSVDGSRDAVGPAVQGKIETNRWYDIKVQIAGRRIQCYLDGNLIIDVTDRGFVKTPDLAASCVRDTAGGDVIIKVVSKADKTVKATIDLGSLGRFKSKAVCTVLSGGPMMENRFGQTPAVLPNVSEIEAAEVFEYEVPSHSLSVIRIRNIK